ncbi:putative transmembrane protein [Gregarina niphandrodes]|uniref:Transmembrane protein n=1 Tax=Gregarina niphandrodes TaxID=110365 RepID=A0A023B2V9_GRENI|nr:putative transmembrane protein [Gregarina niphandrodes]EZG55243.1 putative transmembrane protein [Gregarina niphandrodes]|eukprot:XP_011131694.1 putative transmembrane protein [Gregarina niphandrodes]
MNELYQGMVVYGYFTMEGIAEGVWYSKTQSQRIATVRNFLYVQAGISAAGLMGIVVKCRSLIQVGYLALLISLLFSVAWLVFGWSLIPDQTVALGITMPIKLAEVFSIYFLGKTHAHLPHSSIGLIIGRAEESLRKEEARLLRQALAEHEDHKNDDFIHDINPI